MWLYIFFPPPLYTRNNNVYPRFVFVLFCFRFFLHCCHSLPSLQQRHSGESIASFRADELQMPLAPVEEEEEEEAMAGDHERSSSSRQAGKAATLAWAEGGPASPQRGAHGEQVCMYVCMYSMRPVLKL